MFNLASLYKTEFRDLEKAERYYLMAIEKGFTAAFRGLAEMYLTKFTDADKVEQYFLRPEVKKHAEASNSLAWLYFQRKIHKQEAIKYAEQAYSKSQNIFNTHTYSTILLWNNDIEKAYAIAQGFLNEHEALEKCPEDFGLFLLLLIAKKQYHLTLKIFNENPHDLKDRFKPIYYALMYFMQKEYPTEYLRMGSELKQTVEEIVEKIQKLAEDYA